MAARDDESIVDDLPAAIILIVVLAVIGFAGLNVLAITTENTGSGIAQNGDEEFFNLTQQSTFDIVNNDDVDTLEVYDSRGRAAKFGNNGGNVSANWSDAESGGSITVSVWVRLDENASVANDYHIATLGNGSASLQFLNGSWSAYYDNGSNSSRLSTTASSPKKFTQVALRSNGSHLELGVNGTIQNETALGSGASISNAQGLFGTVDELREFDNAIADGSMTELYTNQIRGQTNESRTARLLLDERGGTSARVLFETGDATLKGDASFTSSGLERTLVKQKGNYTLDRNGDLSIQSGGYLDPNPVMFVSYGGALGSSISSGVKSAIDLLSVIFTLILLTVVVARLKQLQNR